MTGTALDYLPVLLGWAVLVPLISFVLVVLFGPRMGRHGRLAGYVATGAIMISAVLAFVSLFIWLAVEGTGAELLQHGTGHDASHAAAAEHGAGEGAGHGQEHADKAEHGQSHGGHKPRVLFGTWYVLSPPGIPEIGISYYIDCLTVVMFAMVTLIATLIHIYSTGYMAEELADEVVDHEAHTADGRHVRRRGRYHRFFQYLSLFCFSMLGLVLSGNVAMTFIFWELVGVCSYFLIGFYIERRSANLAANKAFIVNRVGDFGMIVGLMALWGSLGTFNYGDTLDAQGHVQARGLFSLIRPPEHGHRLHVPDGAVKAAAAEQVAAVVADHLRSEGPSEEALANAKSEVQSRLDQWRQEEPGRGAYWLLVVAGLGIFCGCVGKSAQFPLHVWLPDAMEGPTPVSALVHSATMVAAGVYLVGRFFPAFVPEVLLIVAIIGCITLFMAATIAITAVDIKRVLAYSTVSQLGYMMLALGVGGWLAGLFHLITHAFFKSLLFMCSGSVIHACHTNDMRKMGGLLKKMPYTGYTMLVGCLAIAGAPFFSGFYSKDYIIAQTIQFGLDNPGWNVFYYLATIGASITAFYMFRLWFMTFWGEPRDQHVYEHVHESPPSMWVPLVILSVFAVSVAWSVPGVGLSIESLLEQARPAGTAEGVGVGTLLADLTYRSEHLSHREAIHAQATTVATLAALAGFLLAVVMYAKRWIVAEEVARQFRPLYNFLWHKWWFDELYQAVFVRPVHFVARLVAQFDRTVIDWLIDGSARLVVAVSTWGERVIDRASVDGFFNLLAQWVYDLGLRLRVLQTGRLRQYVVFIVVGTVALFVLVSFWTGSAIGGR